MLTNYKSSPNIIGGAWVQHLFYWRSQAKKSFKVHDRTYTFFYKKHVHKKPTCTFLFQSLFYSVFNNTTAQNISNTT